MSEMDLAAHPAGPHAHEAGAILLRTLEPGLLAGVAPHNGVVAGIAREDHRNCIIRVTTTPDSPCLVEASGPPKLDAPLHGRIKG